MCQIALCAGFVALGVIFLMALSNQCLPTRNSLLLVSQPGLTAQPCVGSLLYSRMLNLNRKTRSATTGSACIGVFKSKATIVQPILPVHLHTQ